LVESANKTLQFLHRIKDFFSYLKQGIDINSFSLYFRHSLINYLMRKVVLSACVASAMILGFSSCEKVKDKVFPSFETNGGTVHLSVPAISTVNNNVAFDETTIVFNLDSAIKAYSAGKFSISNAESVKIKTVTVDVDGDDQNNISNFSHVTIKVSSNSNTTGAVIVDADLMDVDQPNVINGNNVELKGYLTGNQITYTISGKLRRATTVELPLTLDVVFDVK